MSEIGAEPGKGRYFDFDNDVISLRLRWWDYTMVKDLENLRMVSVENHGKMPKV